MPRRPAWHSILLFIKWLAPSLSFPVRIFPCGKYWWVDRRFPRCRAGSGSLLPAPAGRPALLFPRFPRGGRGARYASRACCTLRRRRFTSRASDVTPTRHALRGGRAPARWLPFWCRAVTRFV